MTAARAPPPSAPLATGATCVTGQANAMKQNGRPSAFHDMCHMVHLGKSLEGAALPPQNPGVWAGSQAQLAHQLLLPMSNASVHFKKQPKHQNNRGSRTNCTMWRQVLTSTVGTAAGGPGGDGLCAASR